MKLKPENIVLLNQQHSTSYLTATLGEYLIRHNLRLTTAESCTGGKLASALCAANDTPKFYVEAMGIKTVLDLADTDIRFIRKHFNVVLERTVRELRGEPCLELEEFAPAKQEIICSRSFGERVTDYEAMRQDRKSVV